MDIMLHFVFEGKLSLDNKTKTLYHCFALLLIFKRKWLIVLNVCNTTTVSTMLRSDVLIRVISKN